MKNIKSLRAFSVKYIGATNFKPSRVKITDVALNKSKTISYNYDFNSAWEVAANYLKNKGIEISHFSNGGESVDFLMTEDFTTELQ